MKATAEAQRPDAALEDEHVIPLVVQLRLTGSGAAVEDELRTTILRRREGNAASIRLYAFERVAHLRGAQDVHLGDLPPGERWSGHGSPRRRFVTRIGTVREQRGQYEEAHAAGDERQREGEPSPE
jgi:hypothetical protein